MSIIIASEDGQAIKLTNRFPVDAQLTGSNTEVVPGQAPPSKGIYILGSSANGSQVLAPVLRNIADGQGILNNSFEVNARMSAHNGASFDMFRNNTQGTLLASATRTATVSSSNITNHNAKGIIVYLDVTVASGTGGLQILIQSRATANKSYNLNATPAAITAVGRTAYIVYPGVSSTSPSVVQATSMALPRVLSIAVIHGDASSYTYQVDYDLIL